jgi:hypothetical protein
MTMTVGQRVPGLVVLKSAVIPIGLCWRSRGRITSGGGCDEGRRNDSAYNFQGQIRCRPAADAAASFFWDKR